MTISTDAEMQLWHRYKSGDKAALGPLMRKFEGMVNVWVSQTQSAAIPGSVRKAEAWKHVKAAIDTYDPGRGAKLSTHVHNRLRKGTRFINTYSDVARMPEERQRLIGAFRFAKDSLTEKHGRPPSVAELYDYFQADTSLNESKRRSLSLRQIARLEREIRPEVITDTSQDFDTIMMENDPKFDMALNTVYMSLTPRDQKIFEHQTGYLGQPVLKNVEIARMVGVSPTTVGKKKRKFQGMMDLALR